MQLVSKTPKSKKLKKLKPFQLHPRRVFEISDYLRVVFWRYGTVKNPAIPIMPIKEVAKISNMRVNTVHNILRRFVENGHEIVMKRHLNMGCANKAKLLSIADELKSKQLLT